MSYEKNKKAEFFGLSGSGKSTLYNQLSGKGQERYVIDKRFFWFWLVKIIIQLFKVRQPRLMRFKLGMLNNLYSIRRAKRVMDYIIIDEGWLQRILTFYEVKLTTEEVVAVCNRIKMPDRVIIMHRNADDCFVRYNNAGSSRIMLGEKYLETWKEVYVHNFNLIKNHLKGLESIEIIEATAHSDLKTLLT